jgi:hypothetical protein
VKKIKKFNEMFEDKYDYDKIIRILKKTHGWGLGTINQIDDFESNEEYFKDPIDENDYSEQFHVFLTDLQTNRLRGQFNNDSKLRIGKWKIGPTVIQPRSIWNQRM